MSFSLDALCQAPAQGRTGPLDEKHAGHLSGRVQIQAQNKEGNENPPFYSALTKKNYMSLADDSEKSRVKSEMKEASDRILELSQDKEAMGMGPPDAAGDADPRFRAPLRPHSLLPPYLPVLRFLQAHAGLHGHEIIHPSSGQEAESRATALATNRGGNGHALLWRGNALHALGHASGASHGNPGPSRARGQTGQILL